MSQKLSPSQIMAVSQGMKDKLHEVARTATLSDNEMDEKIIISFVGPKECYKTGILFTHGKKKVPKAMELPIYFAHSNYVINLSSDHRVTFDPRDLRDDDDAETIGIRKDAYFYSTGFVLCFNPYEKDHLKQLEKKYLPEILSIKKKAKKEMPFVLFSFDWNPNNNSSVKRNIEDRISHDEIINFAKKVGDLTAYIELPQVSVECVDYVMDLLLRCLYQVGGQFRKKGLDDSDLEQMETYAQARKTKKCLLM